MWVVDIIENCITLWNSTLSSIWSMLTQSPETFHNGAVWDAITKIFTALQGAGYGLLVLFFAMSFFKHTVSFREFRHPEQIIGYLIRFVAAKVLISQGMEVIKLIFKISGSFIGDIAAQMGGLTEIAATLPENIRNAIEDASIIPQIFIYLVSLILSAVVIVLSISLLMTVYGRFFRIYMYVALAPLPMSTFAGELTSRHGRTYMQGLIGACMEAIVIVIACIIFNAFTSVDGSDFPINFGDSGVGLVLTYMLKVIIQMVILGSMVKAATRSVKRYGVKCKSRDTQLSRGRSHGPERAADGLRSACRRLGRRRELRLTAVSWNRTCECRMYSGGGNSGSNRLCVLSWSAL